MKIEISHQNSHETTSNRNIDNTKTLDQNLKPNKLVNVAIDYKQLVHTQQSILYKDIKNSRKSEECASYTSQTNQSNRRIETCTTETFNERNT